MRLSVARQILREACIIPVDNFSSAHLDRAIQAAAERFLGESGANVTSTNIAITTSDQSVDITATVSGFVVDDFIAAEISFQDVRACEYHHVRRRWENGTPTSGRPTEIGFRGNNYALFDKPADQGYTMAVTHVARLTEFTPGTQTDPTLNLPARDAVNVIRFGAKATLLYAHPEGQPESLTAMKQFENLIAEAAKRARHTIARG